MTTTKKKERKKKTREEAYIAGRGEGLGRGGRERGLGSSG